jgi:integrase
VSGYVEDRWMRDGKRTAQWGSGMRYRARWTDADGAERCKSFPDRHKEDALNHAQAAATDVLRGTWQDPKTRRITLREFTEQTWLPAQGGVPSTRNRVASQLNNHILPQLGSKTLTELARSPSIIAAWVRNMQQAPSTAGVILGILSSILATAMDDGLIGRNPCKAQIVRAPRVPERELIPWEPDLIAAIRAGLPERWQAMTECGADLGLRQGETLGLAVDAIEWLKNQVRVTRQLRTVAGHLVLSLPKGGRERTVPLPHSTSLALAAHVAAYPPVTVRLPWGHAGGELTEVTLLFTMPTGKAIRASDFDEHHWKPAVKRAGRAGARADGFHMLRHTFASVLLAEGEDILTVARHLGHARATTTLEIYGHVMPGREDRTRRIIDSRARTDRDRTGGAAEGSGAGQA